MEPQASTATQTPPPAEPREPERHRHLHFRRRRVLWALGLDSASQRCTWGVELDG